MCPFAWGEKDSFCTSELGKSCPTEILDALTAFNADGCPIRKQIQSIFRMHGFVARDGKSRARSNTYIKEKGAADAGEDIFWIGI